MLCGNPISSVSAAPRRGCRTCRRRRPYANNPRSCYMACPPQFCLAVESRSAGGTHGRRSRRHPSEDRSRRSHSNRACPKRRHRHCPRYCRKWQESLRKKSRYSKCQCSNRGRLHYPHRRLRPSPGSGTCPPLPELKRIADGAKSLRRRQRTRQSPYARSHSVGRPLNPYRTKNLW